MSTPRCSEQRRLLNIAVDLVCMECGSGPCKVDTPYNPGEVIPEQVAWRPMIDDRAVEAAARAMEPDDWDATSFLDTMNGDDPEDARNYWRDKARAALTAAAPFLSPQIPDGCLNVGHQVVKTKGYPFPGEVRAVFKTRAGFVRYVVEATGEDYRGLLHIYDGTQLALPPPPQERTDG